MGLRRVLAALCIMAMLLTGIGVAIYMFTHPDAMDATMSSPRSSLVPPEPKVPTPDEFKVGVQVTATDCPPGGVCTYTYSIEPNYVGFHPLPKQGFTVFYEVVGGNEPQPGNFTVANGSARVLKDVRIEGPPGAQLQARVTDISLVSGPMPAPPPGNSVPEELSPQPIN